MKQLMGVRRPGPCCGCGWSATYGSTEKGSLEAAKAIKEHNPDAKVLYYRNVMVHYQGYDVNESLEKIDRPLLMDASGNINLIHNGKRGGYDLTNPELRRRQDHMHEYGPGKDKEYRNWN